MKCRYDAVLFDLDGTLANTLPSVIRIFNQISRERDGQQWTLEKLIPYFGPPETVVLRNLFPEASDYEEIIEKFFQLTREDAGDVRPFPGLGPIISRLSESGARLAVYSGASTLSAQIRVGHAGLLDHFEIVLGGDKVEHYKPHPEGLIKLLDQFRVAPDRAIYIGDMVADILAGRNAGMKTVAVTWGAGTRDQLIPTGPDFLIEEASMLERILFA